MIHEIQAKTLLSHAKQPDPWFGIKYTMNLYRGCQHQCIYCDSRSECYQIENFRDVLVKVNAIERLRDELPRKRSKGTIGTGSMNDPYMPVERQYNLTGQALAVIAEHNFPVHVLTKSDLVLKDLPTLQTISRVLAVVSFSLISTDDDLMRKLEPGAPSPSRRLRAMATLAEHGIHTGLLLMPVLPYLTDTLETITRLVEQAHAHGAEYILPAFGMTLRDRQRAYYYNELDRHFPGVRAQYERRFGERYSAAAPEAARLKAHFESLCARYHIATHVPHYDPPTPPQLPLLG
ncbi:MAG TPA: radical SAM protein [Phototrophicaceae bacterium]|nr:radical SAM protein [Phototrophicaceae bacterium]